MILCPETLAVYPNKTLLECETEVATTALNVPKAVSTVMLEEFTAEALLGNCQDVAPNAGGLQPTEMLSKPAVFPDDDALARLEIIVNEKLVALLLLLFTRKLGSPRLDVCGPPNPKEGKG